MVCQSDLYSTYKQRTRLISVT